MYRVAVLNRYSVLRWSLSTRWFWHGLTLLSVVSLLGLVYVKFSIKHSVMQRSVVHKQRTAALSLQDSLLSEHAYLMSPAVLKKHAAKAGLRLPTKRSIVTIKLAKNV